MTLIYFIKCFVSMGIVWGVYKLVLADKKSFLFNRGFLLVSIVGLAFVPFLSLPSSVAPVVEPMMPQIENVVAYAVNLNEAPKVVLKEAVSPIIPEEASTRAFNWMWIFYFVGFVLLFRIIYNIGKLSIAAQRNLYRSDGQIRIIDSKYKNTPFSFFNNLFLSAKQIEEGLPEEVLSHELCHINHYHSIDRVVVELILLIQWWNPFAHLLIKSLKENHEFTADDYALRSNGTSNELIDQILSYSTRVNSNQLFQIGFARHAVVQRIRMIRIRSRVASPFLVALSVLAMFAIAISCTDSVGDRKKGEPKNIELVTVVDDRTNIEFVYPKSLIDRASISGDLLNLPEYRSPNRELFKKFITNPAFEIYLDQKILKRENYKTLKYESVKSFDVKGVSSVDGNTDFRANLYTHDGYFKMMNTIITQRNEDMDALIKEHLKVDLLWSSLEQYKLQGGAPESEIPKPKIITEELFLKFKDPRKFRIKIDNRIANHLDLNQMEPSDFGYYAIDNISAGRGCKAHLITKGQFALYIDQLRNGSKK